MNRAAARCLKTAAVTLFALIAVVGCTPSREIDGDLYLEYGGPDVAAVEACARDAADGGLRDDQELPGGFRQTQIEVGPSDGDRLEIRGVLRVLAGEPGLDDELYRWTCSVGADGRDPVVEEFGRAS